ncbi:MAG TPA: lysophospholipase [Polyangiales bacterium]
MKDLSFASHVDDTKIYVYSWRPQGPARAVLVISHGFKAHGGLYGWAGEQFVNSGLAVYAIDHRGHGNSGGDRYEATHVDEFVADLDQLVELAKARDPGLPVFLLGHSAGGVIGCVYALEHQEKLAGFLCESYALGVYAPGFALAALKGLSYVAPHLHVLDLKNELFSRDPKVVEALDHDPLIPQMNYPTGTVAALVRATERVRAEFANITLPVLIMHGTEDKVTEPAGSQLFFEGTGSKDKSLKLYQGHVHDLLADVDKEVPMADMRAWIEAHLSAGRANTVEIS